MTKIVKFNVAMSCGGCSGAVTRILGKIAGVEKVDPNLETKIVTVTCDDSVVDDTLLQALLTWGKASNKTVELLAS
jgi:copper chaperone